jgi:hypothetical protein
MMTLRGYAAEVEREKASQRARDALERKARKGYNTGGTVYGYINVPVYTQNGSGEEVKSHTEYRIHPEQAEVIRAIFRMYADGYGYTTVVKALNGAPGERFQALNRRYLNGQTPPSPSAGKRGSGSWAVSAIQPMLRRKRYLGWIPFGEYRNTRQGGSAKKRVLQADYLEIHRPELAIVSQDLWEAVQARLEAATRYSLKATGGERFGRPDPQKESKYLLSSLARCSLCGSSIVALGGKRNHYYYGCSYHHNRGCHRLHQRSQSPGKDARSGGPVRHPSDHSHARGHRLCDRQSPEPHRANPKDRTARLSGRNPKAQKGTHQLHGADRLGPGAYQYPRGDHPTRSADPKPGRRDETFKRNAGRLGSAPASAAASGWDRTLQRPDAGRCGRGTQGAPAAAQGTNSVYPGGTGRQESVAGGRTNDRWGLAAPRLYKHGVPKGVRTPVAAVRGRSPRPLDDGDVAEGLIH